MSRYTVSRHDAPEGTHFDLFLEAGAVLHTWRLSAPPETGEVRCERIGDHRASYLDYEGEVSGNRGRVSLHARGTYARDGEVLLLDGGTSAGTYRFQGAVLRRASS